ncbi:hypothetical protein EDB80DRAFT_414227 [Ilyonectria destructans]|nr:hypothetical protein EDB80DRAFT_414227 [Ilyonectria destructans]
MPYVERDRRYQITDEFVEVLYKIRDGSWGHDVRREDAQNYVYADPKCIRWINHNSANFSVDAPRVLDPSPQRIPFLLQTGTNSQLQGLCRHQVHHREDRRGAGEALNDP